MQLTAQKAKVMRPQDVKITFLSPIRCDTVVANGKRQRSPYFYLLQTGSSPIKLEYASKDEARANRAQLLQSPGANAVPSMRLFLAIQEAMDELSSLEINQSD